jgi:hypothetical protein
MTHEIGSLSYGAKATWEKLVLVGVPAVARFRWYREREREREREKELYSDDRQRE